MQLLTRFKRFAPIQRLRRERAKRHYFSLSGFAAHFGVFSDFEEARTFLPPSKEFDNESLASEYVTVRTKRIFSYDYPVIYWLTKVFGEGARKIFDIGGSVGVHYFAYRKFVEYPVELRWHIFEVPVIAKIGSQYAEKHGESALSFGTELDFEKIDADIWVSAGALHYIETAFNLGKWLRQCSCRPNHILLNKLPIYSGKKFVSTQNIGDRAFTPHYVYNRDEFISEVVDSGYELVDEWSVPARQFVLFDDPVRSFGSYSGLYFRACKR
jgi:putative methyltransferase (TIGR04325 family)